MEETLASFLRKVSRSAAGGYDVRTKKLRLRHFYDSDLSVLPGSKGAAVSMEPAILPSHCVSMHSLGQVWDHQLQSKREGMAALH